MAELLVDFIFISFINPVFRKLLVTDKYIFSNIEYISNNCECLVSDISSIFSLKFGSHCNFIYIHR